MDHLKAGEGISIALRLSVLGASNPIDLTTADHQVLIWRPQGNDVWVMGPMHRHSNTYHGHKAPSGRRQARRQGHRHRHHLGVGVPASW